MAWRLLLTLATAAQSSSPTPGIVPGFVDGGRLYELCRETGPEAENSSALCLGYVVGAVDQIAAREARRAAGRRTICLPPTVTAAELAETVSLYLGDSRRWSDAGSTVVREALSANFPCRTPPPRPVQP